jgi:hypothetical protein
MPMMMIANPDVLDCGDSCDILFEFHSNHNDEMM